MSAYVHNITIDSGTDFETEFNIHKVESGVVNLEGYTAAAQLRKHRESSTAVNFNIAFVDRPNGRIKLSIPLWKTSRLNPGRYFYDVIFQKPNGTMEMVLEGSVNVRAGISTGCFDGSGGLPGSAHRLCIAVIDESASQSVTNMYSKWEQFRTTYPNRTFYLLQPTPIGCCGTDSALGTGFGSLVDNNSYTTLRCPTNFLQETTVNTGRLIGQ